MYPSMHHLFFLLFFLSMFMRPATPRSTKFLDCSTTNIACRGDNWNISYPFRLPGMPAYCGHPGYEVQCVPNTSVIQLSIAGKKYKVGTIIYPGHFVEVSNLDFLDDHCPRTLSNTTIDFSLFSYSRDIVNMTVFFNCPPLAHAHTLKNSTCLSSNTSNRLYYSLPADGYRPLPVPPDLFGQCSGTVQIPMYRHLQDSLDNGRLDFLGVLQNGFGLNWVVGVGWCGECMRSDGVCGTDPGSPKAPACFCRDGRVANGNCTVYVAEKNKPPATVIGIAVTGIGGALILGCCIFLFLYSRRKKQRQRSLSNLPSLSVSSKISSKRDSESCNTTYHTHIFSYDELEDATNGFNASRVLGDGGFGTVYKGELRDGRTVAVKRLYKNNYRRLEQFMNEVEILSRLRHQNLVALYGCTSRHSRELLLVYEFIPRGTLADHLHGSLASEEPLPWSVRMSIAIETADALSYLHAVEPQIIHRDVKTTNILLDNGFHVKVADFGLSRLFPLHATHVSTAPQGTPGYVDPEYYQCYQLTDKSDVYSFGVVLVELISSKPAVDISRQRHEINLASMAITKIQNGQIDQLVALELGYQSDAEIKRIINQVAELAFRCLQPDGEMRPCIKEVLEVLKSIQGGVYKAKKEVEMTEVHIKEEIRLLKDASPFSPDSVTERWSTTPATSS